VNTIPARTIGQRTADDVEALLRARNPLLWIITREELRVERSIAEAAAAASYHVRLWDCATGVTDAAGKEVPPGAQAKSPMQALKAIQDARQREVWLLRDMHHFLRDPSVQRTVRSLARSLPSAPRNEARAIIILTPMSEVPPELAGHAIVVQWPMPDRAEIAAILETAVAALDPGAAPDEPDEAYARSRSIFESVSSQLTNGQREAAVDAAVGLSAEEAASCYAKSLVMSRSIDPKAVAGEKKRVIARERVLEWHDPDPRGLDAVGGLDLLKGWLATRKAALSQRARAFGIPAPKGVMLVGVPGCGKSLTAKAVATAWGVPLLRLDLGALRSKWVGESEANIRKALSVAENVAPCVLWIDEIEKALSGGSGRSDGGIAADTLGSILSWMQEHTTAVFVVATANDVAALPPELLRKGRFDDIFFVDLPTQEERAAILGAALRAHQRDHILFDVRALAAECVDYTGAELAALVPDALLRAFADGEREVTVDDLRAATAGLVPLARTAAEKIARVREWAQSRARRASSTESAQARQGRALDIPWIGDQITSPSGEIATAPRGSSPAIVGFKIV
jgi:hypothetical protein